MWLWARPLLHRGAKTRSTTSPKARELTSADGPRTISDDDAPSRARAGARGYAWRRAGGSAGHALHSWRGIAGQHADDGDRRSRQPAEEIQRQLRHRKYRPDETRGGRDGGAPKPGASRRRAPSKPRMGLARSGRESAQGRIRE